MSASLSASWTVNRSHHGQLGLQFLDAVFLEVELWAQHSRVLRGLLGLPTQVPLLPFQQIFLFGQHFHRILTLLAKRHWSLSDAELSMELLSLSLLHLSHKIKKKQHFKEAKFGNEQQNNRLRGKFVLISNNASQKCGFIFRGEVSLKSSLFCAARSCVWSHGAAPLGSPAWRKVVASGSPGQLSPLSDAYGPTS